MEAAQAICRCSPVLGVEEAAGGLVILWQACWAVAPLCSLSPRGGAAEASAALFLLICCSLLHAGLLPAHMLSLCGSEKLRGPPN